MLAVGVCGGSTLPATHSTPISIVREMAPSLVRSVYFVLGCLGTYWVRSACILICPIFCVFAWRRCNELAETPYTPAMYSIFTSGISRIEWRARVFFLARTTDDRTN